MRRGGPPTQISKRGVPALIVGVLSCSALQPGEVAPFGEALVVADTDLPVPRVVSRLRVDIYAEDGRWAESRDFVRPDVREWPSSFSVFTDDERRPHVVLVRLRAYPDGREIPYRGVFHAPLVDLLRETPTGNDASTRNGEPRLFVNGIDGTPALEPDPIVTIDRLVRLTLAPGKRGRVRVLLSGACVGAMARLPQVGTPASCVDGTNFLSEEIDVPLEDTLERPTTTAAGSWSEVPCATPAQDDRVCVPGGAFTFGDRHFRPPASVLSSLDARPERIIRISRFSMDRDEVSVARYRAALARGFAPPVAVGATEGDGPSNAHPDACTFSATPRDREGLALTCVAYPTARAFCLAEGGDLPTEAQWEYAASAAGRATKTLYTWGDDPPTCDHATFGHGFSPLECPKGDGGPLPFAGGDETPLGIRNLTGNLEELMRDSHAAFGTNCWVLAPPTDPQCDLPAPPECVADPTSAECRAGPGDRRSQRGGSWFSTSSELRAVRRTEYVRAEAPGNSLTGFRCVYPAP